MERLVTFRWRSAPPTSVDEELAVYDDASARLVVRASRSISPMLGTYRCPVGAEDLRALARVGPDPVVFDVVAATTDEVEVALRQIAERVAAQALQAPEAVATFQLAWLRGAAGGAISLALLVAGSGDRAVQFELDPEASSIQFSRDRQPIGWYDLPQLSAGFVTAAAVGLGGLRRRAMVEPGAVGAIALDVPAPEGATAVAMRVVGWLAEALPDDALPARFEVRTGDVGPGS